MDIQIVRTTRTEKSTIGILTIKGQFACYTLEPTDRGLKQEMSLNEIIERKIKGVTCIPEGFYKVSIDYSDKFNKRMPLINSVLDYQGIRIHQGNYPQDTQGCILLGRNKLVDEITDSRSAFANFFYILNTLGSYEYANLIIKSEY